jgi:hypothetical protein
MMRKFTTCLFIGCSTWFYLSSCNDDEASAPPKTTFTMDKTATLTGEDVTFVVEQVEADAIAILPYGSDETGKGGVLIPASAFENSVATVKIKYEFVGSFSPVVVTSNFTGDGKSIERTYSDARSIVVTNDDASITEFSFDGSTKTTINQDVNPRTIVVEMPWENDKGVHYDITKLKAKFSASADAAVTIGGAAQSSGATENSFTTPKTYTVTANNGTTSTYQVTVVQTAEEVSPDLKSFSGKSISTTYKDKPIQGYVDNAGDFIVALAPHGKIADVFDSVRVKYETAGKFSIVHYPAAAADTLAQDSLLNLINTQKSITVEPQAAANKATYPIYHAIAPLLELSFNDLTPDVTGKTEEFAITLKVLKGTDVEDLVTTADITTNPGQVATVANIQYAPVDNDDSNNTPVAFNPLVGLDFSTPIKFFITVVDSNIGKTFKVEYTATVVVLE